MLAGSRSFLAEAHPHVWIDLRSTIVLDENGHVIGIEQEWLFDYFYSVFSVDGVVGDAQKEALTALAETNLKSLRAYNYFTEVKGGQYKSDARNSQRVRERTPQ